MHTRAASVHVDASPESVWKVLSDLTRMGEWSPETYKVEWLGGATAPAPGVRFRGWNRRGPGGLVRYRTTCEIEIADGHELAFVVIVGGRSSTRWRYVLEPGAGGTQVTETCEQAMGDSALARLTYRPARLDAIAAGMQHTLERLKAAVEASTGKDR